jgi:hypothetical protein
MLGTNRDTSEENDSGIFMDELKKLLAENGLSDIRIFAVRRLLIGEPGLEERMAQLREYIAA